MIDFLARAGVFEALTCALTWQPFARIWRGVVQRDQLVLTRRVGHLSADDALAGLRPAPIGTWAVR